MAPRSRGRKSARSRSVSASASNSPMTTGGNNLVAPIISSLIAIAINAYLLDYILRLEKRDCECSNHWQRDYIKYFSIVIIVISVLMIILALSGVRARGALAGLLQFVRSGRISVTKAPMGISQILNNFKIEINNFYQVCPKEMLNKLENPITFKYPVGVAS